MPQPRKHGTYILTVLACKAPPHASRARLRATSIARRILGDEHRVCHRPAAELQSSRATYIKLTTQDINRAERHTHTHDPARSVNKRKQDVTERSTKVEAEGKRDTSKAEDDGEGDTSHDKKGKHHATKYCATTTKAKDMEDSAWQGKEGGN